MDADAVRRGGVRRLGLGAISAIVALGAAPLTGRAAGPNVLLVGPAGTPGAQYTSIQNAVDHAQPGDWVLVAPGVYHEKGSSTAADIGKKTNSGVLITTPGIHLRGMNRDTVIVDGTNISPTQQTGAQPAGSTACSSAENLQDPGPVITSDAKPHGRNGIEVYKVSGVSIENLSVCNYMSNNGSAGNEIWWNGGDGSGVVMPMAIKGDYITATSTFYKAPDGLQAQYGIFTSNESGPALIDHSYASNQTDSSYYIGACRNCNAVLDHPHAEFSALGLSSTNAGGNLAIQNGEWDNNRTGLVSNAQNNDDFPSPEYGQCVGASAPPAGAGPNSCYVIRGNYIHDNNNPNTPGVGLTAVSAIGAGVELAATQHISVVNNRLENNGSWAVITHDLPDPESGPANCRGGLDIPSVGVPPNQTPEICYFYSRGNYVANNQFKSNGGFGNVTNGDIANQANGFGAATGDPENPPTTQDPNCFTGNTDNGSPNVSEDPPNTVPGTGLQEASCSPPGSFDTTLLFAQLVCATGADSLFTNGAVNQACPQGASYPTRNAAQCGPNQVAQPSADDANGVCFGTIAYTLSPSVSPPMPDPCSGVPANAYCAVSAAPSPTPLILPPTATARPAAGLGAAAAILAMAVVAGLLVLPFRPRRRRG